MAKKHGMEFQLISITPRMAAEWLENTNEGNRRLSEYHAQRMARDMKNGSFALTHECIAFEAETNRLIDGQHRLRAIVVADKTVRMWVCFGCHADAQLHIDEGRKRSLADAAQFIDGIEITKRHETVARAMMDPMGTAKATRAEEFTFYKNHQVAVHFACDLFTGFPRELKSLSQAKVVALVARASYTRDGDRLREFVETLKTGMVVGPCDKGAISLRDNILTLRDKNSTDGNVNRRWVYRRAEYCLDKHLRRDARVGRKTIATESLFPIPGESNFTTTKANAA